jgi:ABC-2 type transport system ATP-binding protein
MNPLVAAENVTKVYRIRETRQDEATRTARFARLLFGETFRGTVTIREKKVVDNVTLYLEDGDVLALLGPNGAGKSTLLEMMATGLTPDKGSITVNGYDTVSQREQAKQFLTPIFPMFGAQNMWTARQNLEYAALLHNVPRAKMFRRMDQILSVIGLAGRADELVLRFSTGMRVRLILGMGLMIDQPIYLMDEPFIGIDPQMAIEIRSFLKNEILSRGRTVLLATNVLEDVEHLCNKAALISEGHLVACGTLQELKSTLTNRETITLEVTRLNGTSEAVLGPLRQLDGSYAVAFSVQNGLSHYNVCTRDSRSCLPGIIEIIQQRGGEIRHVQVTKPSLADVFLHYTGQRLM